MSKNYTTIEINLNYELMTHMKKKRVQILRTSIKIEKNQVALLNNYIINESKLQA